MYDDKTHVNNYLGYSKDYNPDEQLRIFSILLNIFEGFMISTRHVYSKDLLNAYSKNRMIEL